MNTFLGYEVRELFDPVQTHAVYKVEESQVDYIKNALCEMGAKRFRVVKTGIKGLKIVCFKLIENKVK